MFLLNSSPSFSGHQAISHKLGESSLSPKVPKVATESPRVIARPAPPPHGALWLVVQIARCVVIGCWDRAEWSSSDPGWRVGKVGQSCYSLAQWQSVIIQLQGQLCLRTVDYYKDSCVQGHLCARTVASEDSCVVGYLPSPPMCS